MKLKQRKDYLKEYGAKTTIVSEIFKENENNGVSVNETAVELFRDNIVKGNMLGHYTKTYKETKSTIGWM